MYVNWLFFSEVATVWDDVAITCVYVLICAFLLLVVWSYVYKKLVILLIIWHHTAVKMYLHSFYK